MMYRLTFLLLFLTIVASAQNSPYAIRQAIMQSIEALEVADEPIHQVKDLELDAGDRSVHIRIYRPSDATDLPVIYQIHGGGFIAGNLDSHDNICRKLANTTNAVVVAVDYRRPPENPFPAALEDCLFVLDWINTNRTSLTSNEQLFLIGDSAGGQLVPALCIKNHDRENAVAIDGQILVNPVVDMRISSVAYKNMPYFVQPYVTDESLLDHPYASPIAQENFGVFPPTLVIVSEKDGLKPEGVAFHKRMQESGQPSVLFEVPGVGHLAGMWATGYEVAQPALDMAVKQLNEWTE